MKASLGTALVAAAVFALAGCEGNNLFTGVGINGVPAPTPGAIQGSVTTAGAPVGAVWVIALELRDSAVTNSSGRFTFPNVPAATYTLSMKAPLHYRLAAGDSSTQTVTVPAGGLGVVHWRLIPAGPIQ
jgi:hypothetical protein